MGFPSVTYTFANSTTADATQVNQNFTDIINGVSDGTKNVSVSAGTFAGSVNMQGAVTLGASTANLITFNGSLTSSIPVGTTNTYDIGSDTFGLASIYLGSGSSAHSTRVKGAAVSSAWTMTLPISGGTSGYLLQTDGTGVTSWVVSKRTSGTAANYALATSVATNAMTVALKAGAGTDATATDTVDVIFRNATAATGTPNLVSISAAMSVVIPNGATLGLASAQNQYIYVYLVQDTSNELAVAGSRIFDEGSLQSCTAITAGSTSNQVLYSTSTHTSRPVRYLGRILSNQTTSGTYAANATEVSVYTSYQDKHERSEVWVNTGNGAGSSSTKIRRWTTTVKNVGTAITYADSATLGGTFTINEDGLYGINYTEQDSATPNFAVSLNSAELTTGANTIVASSVLAYMDASSNNCFSIAVSCFLKVGDVIRGHMQTSGATSNSRQKFHITKLTS